MGRGASDRAHVLIELRTALYGGDGLLGELEVFRCERDAHKIRIVGGVNRIARQNRLAARFVEFDEPGSCASWIAFCHRLQREQPRAVSTDPGDALREYQLGYLCGLWCLTWVSY